ncbi:MAG: hypothetical protein ACHQ4G_04410 [Opitutales bacterium]
MSMRFRVSLILAFGVFGAGLGGCRTQVADPGPVLVARFLLESDAQRGALAVRLPVSGVQVRVAPKPVITEYDIVHVIEAKVDLGPCLLFQLTPAAARDVYRLSARNLNRRLLLVLNGEPVGVRVIDRPLEAGMLFIFLEVPNASLPKLVNDLNRTCLRLQREAQAKK